MQQSAPAYRVVGGNELTPSTGVPPRGSGRRGFPQPPGGWRGARAGGPEPTTTPSWTGPACGPWGPSSGGRILRPRLMGTAEGLSLRWMYGGSWAEPSCPELPPHQGRPGPGRGWMLGRHDPPPWLVQSPRRAQEARTVTHFHTCVGSSSTDGDRGSARPSGWWTPAQRLRRVGTVVPLPHGPPFLQRFGCGTQAFCHRCALPGGLCPSTWGPASCTRGAGRFSPSALRTQQEHNGAPRCPRLCSPATQSARQASWPRPSPRMSP